MIKVLDIPSFEYALWDDSFLKKINPSFLKIHSRTSHLWQVKRGTQKGMPLLQ